MSGGFFDPTVILRRAQEEVLAKARAAEELRKAVHNEQIKLRATAMNVIAVGFVVTGVIAPFTNTATAVTPTTIVNDQSLAFIGIWLLLALILHCGATLVLRNLR